LSFIMSGMCLWAAELLDSGVGSMIGTWQFWGSMLSVLLLVFMGLGLMFVLSTAMISPASANRALPIRTYITAMWLVGGACAVAWSVSTRRLEPVCIWEMVFGGLLCLVFLASVSERETLGPRVAKQIPQRVTVRLGLFFFYSGGAGGVLWATVLFLLTLGVAEAWRVMNPAFRVTGDLSDISARMTNLGMYFLGYAMMGLFIRRVLLGRFVKPVLTWMVVVGLMVACTMIPLLAAFFAQIEIERHQNYVWSIANPFSMFVYTRHVPEFTAFAVGWAVLGVFLNLRWFYRQIRSFRPLHQDEPAVEPQAA